MAKQTRCRCADPTGAEISLAYFITDRLDEQKMIYDIDAARNAARGIVLRALVDFRVEHEVRQDVNS